MKLDVTLIEFDGKLENYTRQLEALLGIDPLKQTPHWYEIEEAIQYRKELSSKLASLAPENYYFGGHPHNPTCIGYWKNDTC